MGRGSERSKTLRRRVKPQANARVVSTGAKWMGPGAILSEGSAVTALAPWDLRLGIIRLGVEGGDDDWP